ncbi:GntR family transcriptional regulator [Paracoccus sp. M683]|uniref:GntR family transcriptional regulator n=1 Tax=Paracoccus sp. M683 TaxID=2594268 RepID=UPI00117C896C|nr:GntR family transcriptional regulator [Paracoccus sp. M683]TRW97838.1 GntR family transcriptional regulator [Paracoccus sp. M683]
MSEESELRHAKGTGWRYVYTTLHDEILSLVQEPGALLDETSLAERFGMSRSPVREALIRLAGDDLVVTLSNRSTIVAPIDVVNFPKYVEALDVVQRMNTRLAAELRSEADLAAMAARQAEFERAVQGGDHLRMSEANKLFHMAIAEAGRNPYLTAFYDKLLNQGRRMLHLHFDFIERSQDSYLLTDEHQDMLVAIRARDVDRADRLAHAHTRQFRDNFLTFMQENYSADFSLTPPANA